MLGRACSVLVDDIGRERDGTSRNEICLDEVGEPRAILSAGKGLLRDLSRGASVWVELMGFGRIGVEIAIVRRPLCVVGDEKGVEPRELESEGKRKAVLTTSVAAGGFSHNRKACRASSNLPHQHSAPTIAAVHSPHLPIVPVDFCSHCKDDRLLWRRPAQLVEPALDIIEAPPICRVVDEHTGVCASIIDGRHRAKALLPGSVPDLELDFQAIMKELAYVERRTARRVRCWVELSRRVSLDKRSLACAFRTEYHNFRFEPVRSVWV